MFSVKNIVRAALLAAAANNANAGLLADAMDAVDGAPGSEVAAAAIDGAAALVDGAMRAGDPDEGMDMPGMDNVPQAIQDAMAAVADLKEGFTEGLPDMPDMPDMPNLDLDETLQSVMDFEAKLFGAEGDKLIEYITELKGAEQGHNDAVKEAIDKLEDYRRTATGTEMLPKEDADRAVLVAEIFTAMIATSPVEMVAEAITALKAADEAPSIEQLEQLKDMMVGGLTGAEIASLQTSDGDVFVDAAEVPAIEIASPMTEGPTTAEGPDFVLEADFAAAASTTTEAPEVRIKHAGAVLAMDSEPAGDDTTTTSSSSSSTTTPSSSSSSTTSTSTDAPTTDAPTTDAPTTDAPTNDAPTTAEATDAPAAAAAEGSVLQNKGQGQGDSTGSSNDKDEFLIPIIAATASVLAGIIIVVAAVFVRRNRRSVRDVDVEHMINHQIPRISVDAVYESQA